MNKENKMQLKGPAAAAAMLAAKGRIVNDKTALPEIGHKFSSWAKEDQNLNELDELLMEHDLLNESPAGSKSQIRTGISAQVHVTRPNGTLSPDQFDLEEVIDEFGDGIEPATAGGKSLEESRKNNASNSKAQITDESNSFDLDNSDDLNRFIQKYETMLDGEGYSKKNASNQKVPPGANPGQSQSQQQSQQPKMLNKDKSHELEDSWGSLQMQAEQMLAGGGEIEDESPNDDSRKKLVNLSVNTSVATVQHNVEEEIIAEEIRLATEKQLQNTTSGNSNNTSSKRSFHKRRDSEADMVEDFDNEYLEDEAFEKGADDIVDEVEEEDALRMIDEEIMNTALAKQDAKKLKELIGKIDGVQKSESKESMKDLPTLSGSNSGSFKVGKPVDQQTKFSSSSKVVVSKYSKQGSKSNLHESNSIFANKRASQEKKYDNEPEEQDEPEDHHLEPLGGSEDDIDEFIKRHLADEDQKAKKGGKGGDEDKDSLAKAKQLLGEDKMPTKDQEVDMEEEPLSDSDCSEDIDGDQMNPKHSLLNGLIRLGNPRSKKYSLTEREHFVMDLENILKILTFRETVTFIFPVLDVYAAEEQDYLKIQLLKSLPFVFKKLMKSPARPSDQEALDLLTVNIFPLISQILMTSDDQVQNEGVQALFKISEEFLPREEAIFLVFNVVQLLSKKADQIDNAKIAVLLLIEKFAKEDYFGKKECMVFLTTSFQAFMEGALFKIKKQMVPSLLAIAKHIDYSEFQSKVLGTYMQFGGDSIWGVRRVTIEMLPQIITLIRDSETDQLISCLEFLKRSLSDDSRWVKNQAFLQFGKAVHEVWLKAEKGCPNQQILRDKIREVSDIFFDVNQIKGHLGSSLNLEESKSNKKLSMSSNAQDEIDKIKECWAFNFPCILLVNGGKSYWTQTAKAVYQVLQKDVLINVRKSLAASLVEICRLINLSDDADENEDRTQMVEVANQFLADTDEIKLNLMPNLIEFVALFPADNQQVLLNSMIRERLDNEYARKTRQIRVKLLIGLFEKFDAAELVEAGFHQFLYESIKTEEMIAHRFNVARVFGKEVVAKLIRQKKYRKDLTDYVDSLRLSNNFRDRQMYLTIAQASFEVEDEIYKKHFAKAIGNEMCEEKVVAVKIMIAKLAKAVPTGYSKSTDKIAEHIKAQEVAEVNQFLSEEAKELDGRRFLDPTKITTKMKAEEEAEEEEKQAEAAAQATATEKAAATGSEETKQNEESKESAAGAPAAPEDETPGEIQEKKEISAIEKTVQIRLCNYSIMVRAAQFNSGLSAQLMALLGGYGSLLFGNGEGGKKLIDKEEEQILEEKRRAAEEEEEKLKAELDQENEEEDEEDTW